MVVKLPNDFDMTHVHESKDIRGTWVRFETISYVLFECGLFGNGDHKLMIMI